MSFADSYPVSCRFERLSVAISDVAPLQAAHAALHIRAMKRSRSVDVVDSGVDAVIDERMESGVTVEDGRVHAGHYDRL